MDYYVNFPVTFLAGYLDDPKRTYYWAVRYQLGWWLEEQGLDLDGAMASTGIAGQMDEQECREVYRQHRGAALVGVSLAIFLSDSNDSNEADEGELMRRLMHYACASVLGAGRAATARKVNYLLLFSRMHGRVKPYKSDDELMENGDRRITAYYTRRRRVTLLGSIAGRGIVFYARPGLRGFWITAGMGLEAVQELATLAEVTQAAHKAKQPTAAGMREWQRQARATARERLSGWRPPEPSRPRQGGRQQAQQPRPPEPTARVGDGEDDIPF